MHAERSHRTTVPSMWWAGLVTVSLVWYVGATGMPKGLGWIDDRLLLHTSAALFLGLSLLLTWHKSAPLKGLNLTLQALCAATYIAVDVSSSGPILNIVLVSQLPYLLGIRRAVAMAVLVNAVQVAVLVHFRDETLTEALITSALFACFQMFSLLIGHFSVQATEARDALAATNAELLATRSLLESTTRDRERLRVSRELHDTAGHALTALKLNLRQLRDRSEAPDRGALDDCLALSSELLEDIRSLVGDLREQTPLDLERALTELTRPFPEPEFRIDVDPSLAVEHLAVAEDLLAVARESITNVVRHARATRCTIAVRSVEGQLRLTVTDDGIGPNGAEGYGIRGMRERMTRAGSGLEITPNAPTGTRVSAVWAAP